MGNPSQRSDSELLLFFCQKGDETAFTHLVQRHHAMMYRSALRVLGNQADAHDALQAALIVFARKASELDASQSLGAWLHRVVLLESANLRRTRNRRIHRETQAMKQQDPTPAAKLSDLLPELDQAIDSLKAKDRTVVILHHLEGETFPAIAEQLGGSAESWRKRCTRALQQLSRKLGRSGSPVSLTVLTTLLSQQKSEAIPLSSQALQGLTREAFTHSTIISKGTIALLLMNSKLILISCFLGGGLLSLAYNPADSDETIQTPELETSPSRVMSSTSSARPRRGGYNLDAILAAIRSYDDAPENEISQESSLRLLMFSVPAGDIATVLDELREVSNRKRFNEIAAALYARWTEIDANEAWASALEEERFLAAARRGVLVTWLSRDPESALAALVETPHKDDLRVVEEFVRNHVQHSPRKTALFVDQVAEVWPEADERLFHVTANAWALIDRESAIEWIASHGDVKARNERLHWLGWRTAATYGLEALEFADRIESPAAREKARMHSIRWLGITQGKRLFEDSFVRPGNDLRGGFPSDWSLSEIWAFSRGSMANYPESYPTLIEHASSEEQRQSINKGVIAGAGYSRPDLVSGAITALDSQSLEGDPKLKQHLRSFIEVWHGIDSTAAEDWLAQQADDAKSDVMRQALSQP